MNKPFKFEISRAQLSQQIGEITAQEWRTVQAALAVVILRYKKELEQTINDQSFPERCNSQADQLDQLEAEFDRLGWHGHATQINYTAGHLRIYAHQLDAKEKGDRS